MPYSARSYEETARECVRIANTTGDQTLKRGLQQLRQICLRTADRLREQTPEENAIDVPQLPNALAKQVLKLRWIGMEDDAKVLQLAMRSLPPERRGTVLAGPFSTD
ncbi:MAG TPA: hypothetical protein VEU06_11890 [Micropepsaceae bacterium]|nr:hypothetical protein [Micropepsaceae bacterium]